MTKILSGYILIPHIDLRSVAFKAAKMLFNRIISHLILSVNEFLIVEKNIIAIPKVKE